MHGATKLELAWTAGPVIVLFLIAAFVFIELPGIKDVPEATAGEEQLEIKVIGPPVLLAVRVPERRHRGRHDARARRRARSARSDRARVGRHPLLVDPGARREDRRDPGDRPTRRGSRPQNEGTYSGQCAELCGLEHARMLASVEVVSQDEFDAWLESRLAEQDAGSGELGQEEWEGVCAKCHGMNGEGGIGPRIAGSPTLTDAEDLGEPRPQRSRRHARRRLRLDRRADRGCSPTT